MNKTQDQGFTLIELLIVIVVLGILATVTVFAVGGITEDAQTNSCAVEGRTIETAVQAFYAAAIPNAYPATVTVLSDYLDDPAGADVRWDVDPLTGVVTATAGQNCA